MTKDDLLKHAPTAGVSAGVAIATALAVSTATAPSTMTVTPPATATAPIPGPMVQRAPDPPPMCAPDGHYDSADAAKRAGCTFDLISDRPYARIECGAHRDGVELRAAPQVNHTRVVECSLAALGMTSTPGKK